MDRIIERRGRGGGVVDVLAVLDRLEEDAVARIPGCWELLLTPWISLSGRCCAIELVVEATVYPTYW